HAGAPVVGVLAPQRREYVVLADLLALPVVAVADRTLRREHLLALGDIVATGWLRHFRIGAAGQLLASRRASGEPVGIGCQRIDYMAIGRRRRAVHAELEAALYALGEAVHLVVLLPIGRIHRIGAPQRRRVGLAPLLDMAVGAVHAIA